VPLFQEFRGRISKVIKLTDPDHSGCLIKGAYCHRFF